GADPEVDAGRGGTTGDPVRAEPPRERGRCGVPRTRAAVLTEKSSVAGRRRVDARGSRPVQRRQGHAGQVIRGLPWPSSKVRRLSGCRLDVYTSGNPLRGSGWQCPAPVWGNGGCD